MNDKDWQEKMLKEKHLLITNPKKLTKDPELQKKIGGIQKSTPLAIREIIKLQKESKTELLIDVKKIATMSIHMIKGYLKMEKMKQERKNKKPNHDTIVIQRQKQKMRDIGVLY